MLKEPDFITCRELIDFIADYLEGSLAPADRREFERHLSVCPPCVAYLDAYKKTLTLTRGAMKDGSPDEMPQELIDAIRAAREKRG